ncbi:MAG: 2-hydroxyglutaryl-CoA dehydratase [Deltaproteobacteria bacterium]|nr:2-hydroxyglutaryl-CoA dehydratase [Deltaproteobacteria bacterium]
MYFLGLDVGSSTCKAVLVDGAGAVVGASIVPTGARNLDAIARARREALDRAQAAPAQVAAPVATGYGRDRVEGRLAAVTEITCHARGIRALLPDTEVLVDIGGQDSKATLLDPQAGRVVEFAMNDKCAAGTGRFLETMARVLEVGVAELGALDAAASQDLTLSSVCTVFAESEVVSLLAGGTDRADIARGLHRAIAARTRALVRRVARSAGAMRISMSGGVARNRGVVRALGEALGAAVRVAPEPDTVGALGAALIARERAGRA